MSDLPFYVVYSTADDAERWRGRGDPALQQLPEGCAIAVVPQAAVLGATLDLDAVKSYYSAQIDADAETRRNQFLTPGSGQAITYLVKENEARAWTKDNTAPTPFLTAEAASCNTTIASLAALVIQQADLWHGIGSKIEAARRKANVEIDAATTIGAIVAAASVNWNASLQ